jgi:protein farnesyltransferase subunit beta
MALPLRFSAQQPSSRLEEILPAKDRIEELSDEELGSDYEDMGTATVEEQANIVYLESVRIPIKDSLVTETSEADDKTAKVVLPYLEGNPNNYSLNTFGIPKLQREIHEDTLKEYIGDYEAWAAAMDAARPWIVYWSLQSMTALGIDITGYQKRWVDYTSQSCVLVSVTMLPKKPSDSKQDSAHFFVGPTYRRRIRRWLRSTAAPCPHIRYNPVTRYGR